MLPPVLAPSAVRQRSSVSKGAVLAIAVAGTALVMIDFNAPLTTLVATAASFRSGPAAQTWMLSGISLGLASTLLVGGRLGDEFGRRRVFLAGTVLLAIATMCCALAPNVEVFVGARVLQGIGGAAVFACSVSVVSHAFPGGRSRQRATGIWGASLGAGIAVGPLLAAGLTQGLGWRPMYAIEAAAALGLSILARQLNESRSEEPLPLDLPGALALGAALSCLLAGLVEGRSGFGHWQAVTPLAVSAVLVSVFVLLQSLRRFPLLELALFRRPDFLAASLGGLVTGVTVIGFMTYLPTVLQKGLAFTPVVSAVVLTLWSATSAVVALLARWLPARTSSSGQMVAGLLVCAAGAACLPGLSTPSIWVHLVPGLVIAGAGSGLVNAALARLAVDTVPVGRAGMGSGANSSARYLGSSAGVAMVVALVGSGAGSPAGILVGAGHAAAVVAMVAVVGALTCFGLSLRK